MVESRCKPNIFHRRVAGAPAAESSWCRDMPRHRLTQPSFSLASLEEVATRRLTAPNFYERQALSDCLPEHLGKGALLSSILPAARRTMPSNTKGPTPLSSRRSPQRRMLSQRKLCLEQTLCPQHAQESSGILHLIQLFNCIPLHLCDYQLRSGTSDSSAWPQEHPAVLWTVGSSTKAYADPQHLRQRSSRPEARQKSSFDFRSYSPALSEGKIAPNMALP